MRHLATAAALLLILASPAAASAAAPQCAPPADLQPAPVKAPPPDQIAAHVTVVRYLLAINWTPQRCRTVSPEITDQALECSRPFGFTLHGLWPDGNGRPYPRYCHPVGPIPRATVIDMFCRSPSPQLLQHEWQAHGACAWTQPAAYFARSAALYDHVVKPRVETLTPDVLTAGAIRAAFASANPWLPARAISVITTPRNELSEVRLCFDLKFQPTGCADPGLPDNRRITLAPSLTRSF